MGPDLDRLRISAVILSVTGALLGEVTPQLRGVSVRVDGEAITGRFIFDTELDDDMRELARVAEGEVVADYWDIATVAFSAEYLPTNEAPTLGAAEHWVFLRREAR